MRGIVELGYQGQLQSTMYQLARQLEPRLEAGERISDYDLGQLCADSLLEAQSHTPQMRQIMQDFANAVDGKILSFIERVKGLQDANYRKKIKTTVAEVTPRQTRDVYALTGIDTTGFHHTLSGGALQHI